MSNIHPFKAILPHPNHAADVSCEPYDVIGTEAARTKADGKPNSFLRVIRSEIEFPAETDPYSAAIYERAKANLDRMIAEDVLVDSDDPAMFIYRLVQDGRCQVGLVCTVDAMEYRENRIRKHEKTRAEKEDDRTNHLLTVSGHAEPVFLAWHDSPEDTEINVAISLETSERPMMHFVADGVTHTLWKVNDIDRLQNLFKEIPELYIADGHHRSAAGERAATERAAHNANHSGNEEYNRILAVIFPESQLKILPYNRTVQDLNGLTTQEFLARAGEFGELKPLGDAPRIPENKGQVNIHLDGQWHQLTFPEDTIERRDPIESLDVSLLQNRILAPILGIGDPRTDNRIGFVGGIHGPDELERKVAGGDWAIAFAMNATSMDELLKVADANEIMPPKSTWFEPKLRSGLFVHRFEEEETL